MWTFKKDLGENKMRIGVKRNIKAVLGEEACGPGRTCEVGVCSGVHTMGPLHLLPVHNGYLSSVVFPDIPPHKQDSTNGSCCSGHVSLYGTCIFVGLKTTLPKTGNEAERGPQPPAQSRTRADVRECLSLQGCSLKEVEGSPCRGRNL